MDNLHQAVVAFMRTSDSGTWQLDESKSADVFEVNFRRGNWKKALFGLSDRLVPGSPTRLADNKAVRATRPMTCRVLMRPSVASVKVRLEFKLFVTPPDEVGTDQRGAFMTSWESAINEEARGLTEYLVEVFGLEQLPAIEK